MRNLLLLLLFISTSLSAQSWNIEKEKEAGKIK